MEGKYVDLTDQKGRTHILDLSKYYPQEGDNFCFLLQAMIGPKDVDIAESFDIEVCTPKWLLKNIKEKEVLNGRHRLIVSEYNYKTIINYIEKCNGNNWDEIALKLSRLGHWEFEDYRQYECL